MRTYLFAYGTLLSGALEPQISHLLARHTRPGPRARVQGRLVDLGEYPGALRGDAGEWIHGQLIELLAPQRCWPALDSYEGYLPQHPGRGLYLREEALARLDLGGSRTCWIYWLRRPPAGAALIEGGDWRRHLERRP